MNAIRTAAEALQAAVKTVPGVRLHTEIGANVDPPAVIVGPPALARETYCNWYTSARFLVWVVVAADEYALERLWDLVPLVADAIHDQVESATVGGDFTDQPGSFPSGATELPAYSIQVDVSLQGG